MCVKNGIEQAFSLSGRYKVFQHSTLSLQMEEQEDSIKIIDMFHGKVFIYDPDQAKVVFVKRKVQEDFGLLVGDKLKEEPIFKIVANFSMNGQQKD
jgi:hypothetical protein